MGIDNTIVQLFEKTLGLWFDCKLNLLIFNNGEHIQFKYGISRKTVYFASAFVFFVRI